MKFVSFDLNGRASYGALDSDRIIDLGARFGSEYADLRAVLDANAIPDMMAAASNAATSLPADSVRLLPVIPNPRKLFCLGHNFHGPGEPAVPGDSDDAGYPAICVRFADALVADGQPLLRPQLARRFDYGGALAVIIGRAGRHITQLDAASHIAGFACFNDAAVHDWELHLNQWAPGKIAPATAGFGPSMATAGEIADIGALTLVTRLNGAVVQQAILDDMIFPVSAMIAYLSAFTPLSPGDVVVTGTAPAQHGQPPRYLEPGDTVEVDIGEVGVLRNLVRDQAPSAAARRSATQRPVHKSLH